MMHEVGAAVHAGPLRQALCTRMARLCFSNGGLSLAQPAAAPVLRCCWPRAALPRRRRRDAGGDDAAQAMAIRSASQFCAHSQHSLRLSRRSSTLLLLRAARTDAASPASSRPPARAVTRRRCPRRAAAAAACICERQRRRDLHAAGRAPAARRAHLHFTRCGVDPRGAGASLRRRSPRAPARKLPAKHARHLRRAPRGSS
jgi:hypothetical protein